MLHKYESNISHELTRVDETDINERNMVSGLTMPAAKVNALNECRTSLSRTEVLYL